MSTKEEGIFEGDSEADKVETSSSWEYNDARQFKYSTTFHCQHHLLTWKQNHYKMDLITLNRKIHQISSQNE